MAGLGLAMAFIALLLFINMRVLGQVLYKIGGKIPVQFIWSSFRHQWHLDEQELMVDNGGRCDLRVSFVLSVLQLFSCTFDGVIDKNTLSRVARIYSTCQNDSQTQHERQTPIRNQH